MFQCVIRFVEGNAMFRVLESAILCSLVASSLAGAAMAAAGKDDLRKLRRDAGGVHPQSMAAHYNGGSVKDGSNILPFGFRDVKVKATVNYSSEYVFRGAQFAKHNVQGGLEVSTGGLYAGGWAVLPTEDDFDSYQTEIDLYAGYGFDLTGSVFADIGANYYVFNAGQNLFSRTSSAEVYGGLSLNSVFNPSVYGFYNFEAETATIEASLDYSLPFGQTDLVLGATGGYASGEGVDYAYFQADAELVYNLNRQASVGVGGHWAISEDERFLDGLGITDNNSTWFGITLKARN